MSIRLIQVSENGNQHDIESVKLINFETGEDNQPTGEVSGRKAGSQTQPAYFADGIPFAVSAVGVSYGGTGATTSEKARENLDVYSKNEIDNFFGTRLSYSKFDFQNANTENLVSTSASSHASGLKVIAADNLISFDAVNNSETDEVTISINADSKGTAANLDNELKAEIQDSLDDKSDKGHTHLYAGSSSEGGPATSAEKINTNAGSATNPVYFSGGVPKQCTYQLNKTVPSDAVFTDTNNKVTQTKTANTDTANYPILLSNSSSDATSTDGARKNAGLYYNCNTQTLGVGNKIVIGGATLTYTDNGLEITFS